MESENETTILKEDKARFDAVIEFAENVLKYGRDKYRENPSPLFADGINTETGEHIKWNLPEKGEAVISNLSTQQNLFRTLTALSILTNDKKYKEAAKAAIKYHFDYLADKSGLLQCGGHRFVDLASLKPVGPGGKNMVHELKNCFPYYELMYEVNPEAAIKYIKAFWNAHVYDWEDLYVGRHGKYGLELGKVWGHPLVDCPPLRESSGLSFINAGNDLIYSAGMAYKLSGDMNALKWSKHLANQYVQARNINTGLGAYQFTQIKKTMDTDDDNITTSGYGDRAKRQFGPEFGDRALEANVILSTQGNSIYGENALIQLQLAKELGSSGNDILKWTISGLTSYAKYAYVPEKGAFRPMFSDGTDLTDFILKRNGYYGKTGTKLSLYKPSGKHLLSYVRAFLACHREELWTMVSYISEILGIGNVGSSIGDNIIVNLESKVCEPIILFAVIDLYNASKCKEYLELARVIGNNILKQYYHNGYFTKGPQYICSKFDDIAPFSLLALQAAIDGKSDEIPVYIGSSGFIAGDYQLPNGEMVSKSDSSLYYVTE